MPTRLAAEHIASCVRQFVQSTDPKIPRDPRRDKPLPETRTPTAMHTCMYGELPRILRSADRPPFDRMGAMNRPRPRIVVCVHGFLSVSKHAGDARARAGEK